MLPSPCKPARRGLAVGIVPMETAPSGLRNRRRSPALRWLCVTAVAAACGSEGPVAPDTDAERDAFILADTVVAPQEYIEFGPCSEAATTQNLCPTVNLEVISCSAAVGCRDGFLRDPQTNEPVFTATTSLTCGFERGGEVSEEGAIFDTLPSFTSQVRCQTPGGEQFTPAAPTFGEHRFYSQTPKPGGSFFLNTAQSIPALMASGAESCVLESWASIHFDPVLSDPPEPRSPRIDRWAPAIEWQTEVSGSGDGFVCEPAYVERHVTFGIVHDRATAPQKLSFPAQRASLILLERSLMDPLDQRHYEALEGIASGLTPARFGPNDVGISFERRVFTVAYPEVDGMEPHLIGRPADIRPVWACPTLSADDFVERVGVVFHFGDNDELLAPGVLIIERELDGQEWECEREGPSDARACRLYGDAYDSSWLTKVPCLGPYYPAAPGPIEPNPDIEFELDGLILYLDGQRPESLTPDGSPWLDLSGQGHDAFLVGAGEFEPDEGRVRLPSGLGHLETAAGVDADYTLQVSFSVDEYVSDMRLFGAVSGSTAQLAARVQVDGELQLWLSSQWHSSEIHLPLGEIVTLTLRRAGDDTTLFVDGQSVSWSGANAGFGSLGLGNRFVGNHGSRIRGAFYQVVLHDRALDEETISIHAALAPTGP